MKKKGTNDDIIGKNLSVSETTAVVLDLSGDTYPDHSIMLIETNSTSNNTSYISANKSNIGGRKKGSTTAAKVQRLQWESLEMKQ
jgi:hypothetical protein